MLSFYVLLVMADWYKKYLLDLYATFLSGAQSGIASFSFQQPHGEIDWAEWVTVPQWISMSEGRLFKRYFIRIVKYKGEEVYVR